jgi:hypothetical protein
LPANRLTARLLDLATTSFHENTFERSNPEASSLFEKSAVEKKKGDEDDYQSCMKHCMRDGDGGCNSEFGFSVE